MSHYYAEPVSIFCLPPGSISSLADQLDPILKQIEAAGAEAQYAALFAELAATGLARFVANAEERFPPAEDGPIIKLLELAANWPQFTNTPANFRQLVTDVLSALQTIRTELHESWNTLALFASNTNLKLTSEGWLMLLEERLVGSPWWNRLWAEVRNWEREKWDEFLRKFAGREGKFGEKAHELKSRLDEFPSEKQFKPRLASLQEKRNTARSRIAREHDAERAMHSDGTIDGWRDEACVWMEREVKAGLKSPSSVPFAELWCFDNVALLEKVRCSLNCLTDNSLTDIPLVSSLAFMPADQSLLAHCARKPVFIVPCLQLLPR